MKNKIIIKVRENCIATIRFADKIKGRYRN